MTKSSIILLKVLGHLMLKNGVRLNSILQLGHFDAQRLTISNIKELESAIA
ncbi:hypothetical protein [Nostoc sp.]|uniref:hypothetical protein n=1 Tax=Nostoc sp. TaxID=1180 RepID=UPI002FF91715